MQVLTDFPVKIDHRCIHSTERVLASLPDEAHNRIEV